MDRLSQLRESFRQLLPTPETLTVAMVVSVEGNTCTVNIDDLDIDGIFLKPTTIGDSKLLFTPQIGSYVLLGSRSGDFRDMVVLAFDEIAKVEAVVGSSKITIDDQKISIAEGDYSLELNETGIILNGGTLGGLVKVADAVTRLNNIETAFNSLLTHYKTHNHTYPQGTTTGFVIPLTQGSLELTDINHIENTNVKQ